MVVQDMGPVGWKYRSSQKQSSQLQDALQEYEAISISSFKPTSSQFPRFGHSTLYESEDFGGLIRGSIQHAPNFGLSPLAVSYRIRSAGSALDEAYHMHRLKRIAMAPSAALDVDAAVALAGPRLRLIDVVSQPMLPSPACMTLDEDNPLAVQQHSEFIYPSNHLNRGSMWPAVDTRGVAGLAVQQRQPQRLSAMDDLRYQRQQRVAMDAPLDPFVPGRAVRRVARSDADTLDVFLRQFVEDFPGVANRGMHGVERPRAGMALGPADGLLMGPAKQEDLDRRLAVFAG